MRYDYTANIKIIRTKVVDNFFSKKLQINLVLTNLLVPLYCNSKPRKMKTKELTEDEAELIEAIRNLKSSKHNISEQLEWYVRDLFEQILRD